MSTKRTIAIIGSGEIGSRHLQAIARMHRQLTIYIVDPSVESLNTAKYRFNQIQNPRFSISTQFLSNQDKLPNELDLAIIATSSNVRRNVIEELLKKTKVRYMILEKVLFQKKGDYEVISQLLKFYKIPTWVNHPKRIWPGYQQIYNKLQNTNPIHIVVSGSDIGLGCNSIHYIDLISYLTNEIKLLIDPSFLDAQIKESKRKGFIEFTGTLKIKTMKGSSLTITSYPKPNIPIEVYISSDTSRYLISETNNKIMISDEENNWSLVEHEFKAPFQSELTNEIVERILDTGTSGLTKYEISKDLHLPMIQAFNRHLDKCGFNRNSICPIT